MNYFIYLYFNDKGYILEMPLCNLSSEDAELWGGTECSTGTFEKGNSEHLPDQIPCLIRFIGCANSLILVLVSEAELRVHTIRHCRMGTGHQLHPLVAFYINDFMTAGRESSERGNLLILSSPPRVDKWTSFDVRSFHEQQSRTKQIFKCFRHCGQSRHESNSKT
jgi:hypothetical protein